MIIKVYNSDVLFETYEFYESSKKQDEDMRHPPLINSMTNDSYLNKYTGFVYYTFILTKAELLNMSKLYAYQEGDYELRWMDGDNSYKCFLISDFSQKKVGYKDDLSQYEFPLMVEIVKAVDLNTNLYYYSESFEVNVTDRADFLAKYTKWALTQDGIDLVASDSVLNLKLISGSPVLYEDFSNYSKTDYTIVFEKVKHLNETTNWAYFTMHAMYSNSKQIQFSQKWTGSQYQFFIQTSFSDTDGTFTGTAVNLYSATKDEYDFKIERNNLTYTSYYKKSTSDIWIQHYQKQFTSISAHDKLALASTILTDVNIDNIIVTPDELRI